MMKAIVLISGKMRSGKNQFAEYFGDISPFAVKEFAFAKALKEHCYHSFTKLNEIYGYNYNKWDSNKTDLTRAILTGVGTDLVQGFIGLKNYWVDKLVDSLDEDKNNCSFALVTDTRYEHEIEGVRKFAYENQIPLYLIRVESNRGQSYHNKILETHASETGLDSWNGWSYIVENNGTLEELKEAVNNVYKDILEDIV